MTGEDGTLYAQLGEAAGVRRLAQRFYAIMSESPQAAGVRAMHTGDFDTAAEKLTAFLIAWSGGPRDYFDRSEAPGLMRLHRALAITADERDQWLWCMRRALSECEASPRTAAQMMATFTRIAEAMRTL
ncbi:MAG: hypothetical protein AB7M12_05895 [Hyphomonadaceae bacterium]